MLIKLTYMKPWADMFIASFNYLAEMISIFFQKCNKFVRYADNRLSLRCNIFEQSSVYFADGIPKESREANFRLKIDKALSMVYGRLSLHSHVICCPAMSLFLCSQSEMC